MQWLKKFAEVNHTPDIESYDAIAAREKGKGYKQFKPAQADTKRGARKAKKPVSTKASTAPRSATPTFQKENNPGLNKSASTPSVTVSSDSANRTIKRLEAKVRELNKGKADAEEEMSGLERERDFYFNKLRDVEIILQNYEGKDEELVRNVLKVLYATDDDTDGEAALAAADAAIKASKEARLAKVAEADEEEVKIEEEKEETPKDTTAAETEIPKETAAASED